MKSLKKFPFPSWLFLTLMVVYHELMLHLWVADTIRPARLAAVFLFGIGFGLAAGFLTALIPSPKWKKGILLVLSFLITVLWLTEYFVYDAYQVFMTPATILSGAGGVAEDYLSVTLGLLASSLWRIGMMLLPTVLYWIFCVPTAGTWKLPVILAGASAAAILLGVLTATANGAGPFGAGYAFDSAVRSFGLNIAMVSECAQSFQKEQAPVFVTTPVQSQPAQSQPEPDQASGSPEVTYGDQVIEGVDYALLAQNASTSISGIYNYLDALPVVKKNEYTGLFAGKNLVLITAEAFTLEAIDPELTPTLYRLANQGIHFTDYYQPAWGAGTTSGEFSNLFGIMPSTGGACMREANQQKMFLSMGFQLEALGYKSLCFHANDSTFYSRQLTHRELGYEDFIAIGTGLVGLSSDYPFSDLETINLTMDSYIHQQPFSVYYMTFSGHSPYDQTQNDHSRNYYSQVADLDYSETVKCYLASQLDLEAAMTALVTKLEELGIADDTVIVISTDHYPYGLTKSTTWHNTADHMAELFGVERYDDFQRDHSALILWSGCLEGKGLTIDDPTFSLDILPTLSNLFGVEYDARLLAGRDVFSDQEPIIFWPNHSWKTDKGTYDYPTNTFTPREGVTVEDGYAERISTIVANRILYCEHVSSDNLFGALATAIGK